MTHTHSDAPDHKMQPVSDAAATQDSLRSLWIGAVRPYVRLGNAHPFSNTDAIPTQCQAIVNLVNRDSTGIGTAVALWMYGILFDAPVDYLVYPAFPAGISGSAPAGFAEVVAAIELVALGRTGFDFTTEPNGYVVQDVIAFMTQKPHGFKPRISLNIPKKQSLVGRIVSPSAESIVNKKVFNSVRREGDIIPPVQLYLGKVLTTYPDRIETLVGTYIRAESVLRRVTMKEIYPDDQTGTSMGLTMSDGSVLLFENPRNYSIGKWSFIVDPQENGIVKWGNFIMRHTGSFDTGAVYFHEDYFRGQLRDKLASKVYCMPTNDQFSIFQNTAYLNANVCAKPSTISCFRAIVLNQQERRNNPRVSLRPNAEELIDRIVICTPMDDGVPYGPATPIAIKNALDIPLPCKNDMDDSDDANVAKVETGSAVDVFVGGDFGDGRTEAVVGIRPILAMLYDLMIVDPKTKKWTVLSDGQILNGDYALEVKSVFGLVSAYARSLRQTGNWLDVAVMRHQNGQSRFVELFHDAESGPSIETLKSRMQTLLTDDALTRPTETTTLFEITRKFELNFHRISGNPDLSRTIRLGTANVVHIQGVSSIVLKLIPVNGYSELEVWGIIRDCLIAHLFISDSANTLMIVRAHDDVDSAPPSIGAVYVSRCVNEHGAVTNISYNDTNIDAAAIIAEQNRIDEVFDMLSAKKEI